LSGNACYFSGMGEAKQAPKLTSATVAVEGFPADNLAAGSIESKLSALLRLTSVSLIDVECEWCIGSWNLQGNDLPAADLLLGTRPRGIDDSLRIVVGTVCRLLVCRDI
jgi:hypothetical protein